jgi:hypothetical protein
LKTDTKLIQSTLGLTKRCFISCHLGTWRNIMPPTAVRPTAAKRYVERLEALGAATGVPPATLQQWAREIALRPGYGLCPECLLPFDVIDRDDILFPKLCSSCGIKRLYRIIDRMKRRFGRVGTIARLAALARTTDS